MMISTYPSQGNFVDGTHIVRFLRLTCWLRDRRDGFQENKISRMIE